MKIHILSAGIALIAACFGWADEALADASGQLHTARWQAEAWGSKLQGAACWLLGSDASLRLEITSLPAEELAGPWLQKLLKREGEGWTLASVGFGSATLNAWGEGWHNAQPLLENLARVLVQAIQQGPRLHPDDVRGAGKILASHPTGSPRPGWARGKDTRPVSRQIQISAGAWREEGTDLGEDSGGSSFRAELEARGRGRGGRQEVVSLNWPVEGPETTVHAVSSRRPGRLVVQLSATHPIQYPEVEGFLPLWSLAELLATEAPENPR